jgi:hypothetical protein
VRHSASSSALPDARYGLAISSNTIRARRSADEEAGARAVRNEAVRMERSHGGCPGAGFQEGRGKTGNAADEHGGGTVGRKWGAHVGMGRQLNGKAAAEAGGGGEEQA